MPLPCAPARFLSPRITSIFRLELFDCHAFFDARRLCDDVFAAQRAATRSAIIHVAAVHFR